MGVRILALDTILSATVHFVRTWSPELKQNQSRDLLRFIICRLYDAGRGDIVGGQLTLAQSTLARKLGLSRQWIGVLLSRLEQAGWLECYAPTLENGMKGSTIFCVGRQLKRLLMTLLKTKPRKKQTNLVANTRWQFSPTSVEKKQILIQQKEQQPPSEVVLSKIPLLKLWLERGEVEKNNSVLS